MSDLVFHLSERGVDVSVVTSGQRYDDPAARLPVHERIRGVHVYRVESTRFGRYSAPGRLLDYVSFVRAARNKLKLLVGPGTIVVAKTDPPMLGMFLDSVVTAQGGRLVNWLQDLFPETLSTLSGSWMVRTVVAPLRYMRDRSLKNAAANVVIGEQMRDYLVTMGVPAGRVTVIHNWPYEAPDVPVGDERGLTAEKETGCRFVVGYFGNLGRVHEHETILGAMRILSSDPHIGFLFVGGGFLLNRLKIQARELGLQNLEYRDYVPREDLPAALKAVDVHLVVLNPALERFVVPSKFAGVVAAERPVLYVGDPDGELAGSIREYGCGYVVRAGDSEELARRMRELSSDSDTTRSMGASSARVYQELYRRDTLLEKWHGVLDGLEKGAA